MLKLSAEALSKIMPKCQSPASWADLITNVAVEFDISTPERMAAFLAQLAHESNQFKWLEEIASGEAYEGRKDLGNVKPGDGKRYKGRGPIQLTGRANYAKYGKLLGLDLEGSPELAATPNIGLRIAGLYWKENKLNALADAGKFDAITKKINGGYNGKADRDRYHLKALSVLRPSGSPGL